MDLNLLTLGTSLLGGSFDATSQLSAPIPDEFQNILEMTQAPPGPEPPPPTPDNSGEKELQTQEPNAQSNQPDLSSTDKTQSSSDKDKKSSQTHAIATGVAVALPTVLISAAASNNALPSPVGGKTSGKGALPSDGKTAPVAPTTGTTTTKGDPTMVSLKELPTDATATIVSTQASSDPTTAPTATPTITLPVINATIDSALTIQTPDSGSTPVPQLASNAGNQQVLMAIAADKNNGFALPTSTSNSTPSVPAPASLQNNIAQAQQAATTGGQTSGGNSGGGQSSNNQNAQTNQQANLDVIRQFADHSDKLALAKSAENVTVHLQSEDNTNVTLNIKSARGEVAAQIVTNNESLRNALHQNRSQLNHSFENKGMNLGQVSVGLNGQGNQQKPQQQQQFNTGATSSSAKETTKSAPGAFPTASAGKGVDLSI